MDESVTDGNPYDVNEGDISNTREEGSETKRLLSDLYYDMSGEKILIVFNHFHYKSTQYFNWKKPNNRNGTAEDAKRLRNVFEDMGFKVTVHQDFDYEQIIDEVITVSRRDHQATSCVTIAILTHGSAGGGLTAADRPYSLKDILNPFQSTRCTLVNKPKLFFIQACRGSKLDAGRVMHDSDSSNAFLLPTHADFLVMFSTVEDFVSWRDSRGSWMVQELCNALEKHYESLDILQIITIVNRKVAYDRISYNPHTSLHNKKSIPETQFTLTKLLRF